MLPPMLTTLCMRFIRSTRRARTSGMSSDMRLESVKRFACSMSSLVMAIPLLGPR